MSRAALLCLALVAASWSASASAACRLALALGLDISGSVDAREYRLQIDGLALALGDPGVIDAFLAMPGAPVRLYVYEWAGLSTQRALVDWTQIDSAEDLARVAQTLREVPRRPRQVATALGRAMSFGGQALTTQADCWKRTLDISGDGRSNHGPRPRDLGDAPELAGVTINALVIGADAPAQTDRRQDEIAELSSYFRAEVIRGDGAFVEVALGYEDYARAMARKLIRELAVLAIGAAAPTAPPQAALQ